MLTITWGGWCKNLECLGLRRNTALIITVDHGEEFFEHKWVRHGHSLNRELLLQVPLIVVPPGGANGGRVVEEPVGLQDVGATVLDLARISRRFGAGESLLHPVTSWEARPVYSELGSWQGPRPRAHHRWGKSLISGRWHLIVRDTGEAELYDLARDPQEQRNLAPTEPERVAAMRRQLERIAARAQPPAGGGRRASLDEGTRQQMLALGYLH